MVKNKKILITGGLGFIGFNTACRFAEHNDVYVVDDGSRLGVDHNIKELQKKGIDFRYLDVGNFRDFKNVYFSIHPDIVIHLAAQVAVTTSIVDPGRDFRSNIQGSFNLLELARISQLKPIVLYASTNKVYGHSSYKVDLIDGRYALSENENGYSEETQLSFETPYGCSKGAADQYFLDYARTYNIPTVVFRQSCIYGPHQYGIEDQGWLAWFAICAQFQKPITIFGDGNQVRDVLYVDDLVDLYNRSIENIDEVSGQAFNVGGGPDNTLSLNELVAMLNERCATPLQVSFDEWRLGDQRVYISDIRKAKKLLGWEPTTRPDAGLGNLLKWVDGEKDRIDYISKKMQEADNLIDVSLVIPAKDEEECLASVLDEVKLFLDSSLYHSEVIVVNDRSTDRTCEIARSYPFVKLVDNQYPPGKGGALRSGFDVAGGKYIAMMDADFSHDVTDLPELINAVKSSKGLVIASRITGGSEEYTRMRGFGNVFLTWFFGFLHGRYLSDVLNGFKVFHRDVYTTFEYTSNHFEIEIELSVNTLRLDRPILEVPSRERARMAGEMKSSVIKHGPRFFWRIMYEYWRSPRKKSSLEDGFAEGRGKV
jgi:CDP-paratose 2-epimerase